LEATQQQEQEEDDHESLSLRKKVSFADQQEEERGERSERDDNGLKEREERQRKGEMPSLTLDDYHIVPGLIDFGMTIRIKNDRRRSFCSLIIALFEKDFEKASKILKDLGYLNNQSDRVPERDAEFFEYLFRDAGVRLFFFTY
jgi:hypothetical protein